MDLHDLARQVAKTSGADFAFVLSQAGLLVTHDAPRDMPDRGRTRILWACPAGKNGEIVHLEMPREDLVPYGGAAPVDVFAIRVEDTAILCAVTASWNDKSNVVLALTTGSAALADMIRKAKKVRAQKVAAKKGARTEKAAAPAEGARRERGPAAAAESGRRERTSAVPAEPARRERTSAVPAEGGRRERTSSIPRAPKEAAAARKPTKTQPPPWIDPAAAAVRAAESVRGAALAKKRAEVRPRVSSEPEIVIGEAPVGRETLYAIEAALPRAVAGPTPLSVRVELDSIGRETMFEIQRIEAGEAARAPTVEEPLVVEDRRTLPWVDAPSDLKRAVEAKAMARGVAPPDLKITVEEMDPDALERALREDAKR